MGKRWRKYSNGPYRLGQLHGEAVACWRDDRHKPHRYRLGVFEESAGRSALDAFARQREILKAQEQATIEALFDLYVKDREKDGKIVRAFHDNWKALKPRFGHITPNDITADMCRSYTEDRITQGRSPGTVWTELTRLRSCLNWAKKRRIISEVPYVWVPTKPDPRDRVLSEDEVVRLLDGCGAPHVRLFVILCLTTAGRSSAICQLTWDRVDFEAGTIDLRVKEIYNPLTKRVRKGRSIVPMNGLARAALQEAKEGALTDHVIEWDGEPIKKARKAFMAAVERAGLGWYEPRPTAADPERKVFKSDVTPHVLRHTANTWMMEADIPPELRARFLGHRNVQTQAIYSHPRVDALRKAAEATNIRLVRKA